MPRRLPTLALAVALTATGTLALFRAEATPRPLAPTTPLAATPLADRGGVHAELPPGHPAVPTTGGAGASPHPRGARPPQPGDAPTLTWTAPPTWTELPNPSSMRVATFRPPRAAGDAEDADVSITRAGGTTDANIERWLGQLDERGKDSRSERTVRGARVTVVEVSGTYLGGMMGGAATRHAGWTLLGAVIEAKGTSYFVKVVGPSATVRAARASFEALLDSFTPA